MMGKFRQIILSLGIVLAGVIISYIIYSRYFSVSQSPELTKWQGIVPGQSLKSDVITKFGSPLKEDTNPKLGSVLLYDSKIAVLPNTVIYSQQTNKVSDTFLTITNQADGQNLYRKMGSLGKPEKVLYSRLLTDSEIYIFATKGVTYSANPDTKMVDSVHYYLPTTLNGYLTKYGEYFNKEKPKQGL